MATAAAVHHMRTKHGTDNGVGEEVGFGAKRKQNQFNQENASKVLIPEQARKHVVSRRPMKKIGDQKCFVTSEGDGRKG